MGVVHFRIPRFRELPLGVRSAASEIRIASDDLCRQAAGDARVVRKAGNAVGLQRARQADRCSSRRAAKRRPAQTQLEDAAAVLHECTADCELFGLRVGAVAAAARRQRERRLAVGIRVAPAESTELSQSLSRLQVQLAARLVRRTVVIPLSSIVVRGIEQIRIGKIVHHLPGETRHRHLGARRVHLPGPRVAHVDPENALLLQRGGNRRERDRSGPLSQPLVVPEEEHAVPHDRAAEHRPELVVLERRLLATRRREICAGIQCGVPEELPGAALEAVGATAV